MDPKGLSSRCRILLSLCLLVTISCRLDYSCPLSILLFRWTSPSDRGSSQGQRVPPLDTRMIFLRLRSAGLIHFGASGLDRKVQRLAPCSRFSRRLERALYDSLPRNALCIRRLAPVVVSFLPTSSPQLLSRPVFTRSRFFPGINSCRSISAITGTLIIRAPIWLRFLATNARYE